MPPFLTTASVLMCPHGGTVQIVASNSNVQAGGTPMVTSADTFTIVGCSFNVSGTPQPCVSVQWVQTAAQSTISNNPTLTSASVGLCLAATQTPQGPVTISTTQTDVSGM
ncbi:hypothetical protein [Bradyrhizobium tropiciagri]|uniref:hypothetical protein n=1 Tax=Bradyrhizobium tropiciagri TaxID=312253 RepID=UPI00067ACB15|nr:hypothetical protein [Bradyrhizobium tropiciagri]